MDLRERFIDVEVLKVLVGAVVQGVVDINSSPGECPSERMRGSYNLQVHHSI